MNFETLTAPDGHADTHAIKAMQELSITLMQLAEGHVASVVLQNNEERNDWNHECLMHVNGDTINAWIELTSDVNEHAGQYRFRLLATLNGNPVTLSLPDPEWVNGNGEANIDKLIAQLTLLETSTVSVAREIQAAMHA